jgi:hypothetical protein
MALANVAEWFYLQGLRVVMIDWDLEAPGLENFFYNKPEDIEAARSELGLIDLLTSYKRVFPRLGITADRLNEGREPGRGKESTARRGQKPAYRLG